MKSTYGILWYFFIIYATSVIVNFSHFHKAFEDDKSVIVSAAKCLMHGDEADAGRNNCKLSFQYKKETVLYFLKNLLSRKEFNKFYKLTLKNGSKKGASDLVNITLDLKPLFGGIKSSTNPSEQLNFWYSFYIFISILLIAVIAPLWPLTNYIYIITLASMVLFSITLYLQLLKFNVFSLVYVMTLKKYKFWILPNLNKDVGLLATFWPLYECDSSVACAEQTSSDESLVPTSQVSNQSSMFNDRCGVESDNTLPKLDSIQRVSDNENGLNESSADDQRVLNEERSSTISSTITEFIGNKHLPTIIATPPPSSKFKFESATKTTDAQSEPQLEIIDLNNEEEVDKRSRVSIVVSGEESDGSLLSKPEVDNYASITPAVTYLNVNEVRRRQHLPARQRIASNRSDDGFEILNNDFLRGSPPSKEDELFVCSKQSL